MATKGFRSSKKPTTKQKIEKLEERLTVVETNLTNASKALQLANMMIKHLTNKDQALEADLNSAMGMLNDFQYRTLSMLDLAPYSKEELEAKAEEFKLKDFYEASDKEDVEKNYIDNSANEVGEDSIVILTSEIKDAADEKEAESGILRSKFHMEKCITPNIREALLGSKVGDKVEVELHGQVHIIEILDHKIQEATEEEEAEETTAEKTDE